MKRVRKNLILIFSFIILISSATVGFAKQEQFLYQYNLSKIKTSSKISERINYAIKALKHSKTEDEVRRIKYLIKSKEETLITPKLYFTKDNYIYYISLYDYSIYRMIKNTGEKTRLTDFMVFTDDFLSAGMIVYGDYIYYINDSDNKYLYRMKNDGSENIKLSTKGVIEPYGFFIMGNHIFYYSGSINKISLGGGEVDIKVTEMELAQELLLSPIKEMKEDKLYYMLPDGIYSRDYDGSNKSKLVKGEVFNFKIKGDKIYFISENDYNIYSTNLDGRNTVKLSDDSIITPESDDWVGNYDISDDYIYYTNAADELKLYKIKIDGSERTKVTDYPVMDFKVYEDSIYLIDSFDNGRLIKINNNKEKVLRRGSFIYIYEAADDTIFLSQKWEHITDKMIGRNFVIGTDGEGYMELK